MPYKNIEDKRKYHREYLKEHPEKRVKYNPEKQREYTRKSVLNNVPAYLYRIAKARAKKRNLEFSISIEDVHVPDTCPILEIPLICGVGSAGRPGGNWNSPSLDRVDNSKGYVAGNVQVISHLANSMKSVATDEQLILFALWVLKEKFKHHEEDTGMS